MIRPALVTVFSVTAFALSAFALGHVALGKHSSQDIKDHCDAAGGAFYNSGGTYGCFGPGGDVTCSGKTKRCFGTCGNCSAPLRVKGGPFGVCEDCKTESVSAILGQPPKDPR